MCFALKGTLMTPSKKAMFSPITADCCVAATVISAQVTSRNATIMARPLSQAEHSSFLFLCSSLSRSFCAGNLDKKKYIYKLRSVFSAARTRFDLAQQWQLSVLVAIN